MFQYLKTKIPPLLIVSFFILIIFLLRNLLGHFSFVYQDYISILFMISYIICILYIKLEFKKHKTTISPSNPDNATSLVQSGFFRFSRNPIYFSLLNIIFWFSIYLGSFFGLIVTPLFVIYMNQFQIIPEEKAMLKLFSDKYKSYCLHVRRWI
ncbi:MAG: methyltransferase family protein [Flavobacteriaceae bacterium]